MQPLTEKVICLHHQIKQAHQLKAFKILAQVKSRIELVEAEFTIAKTAFEIDQRWIIELGADRTPYISQAQSINVFIPADIHKKELHDIHFQAWKKGLKSLYYCRSKSIQRAEDVTAGSSTDVTKNVYKKDKESENKDNNYEECLSCQQQKK